MKQHYSKGTSLALIAGMYVLALCVGVGVFVWAVDVMPEVWALLVADVVMTVLIWSFGIAYENVSIYDPYWSVIPPAMFTAWALYKHCFTLPVILLLVAVWWWGVWLMYASLRGVDWLMLAPFAMTDLFLFISIPMMERRQLAHKPAYAEYRKRTRLFI